tara:strand:+ start:1071 stop:3560 length:2490 start_codon:yes stop_codon:yes gene_type:complete
MSKIDDANESFKDQRDILKEINSEINTQKTSLDNAAKSYNQLEAAALKLQNNEEELSKLSEKQLKTITEKAKIALRELQTSAKQIQNAGARNDKERAIVAAAKEKFKIEKDFVKNVEKQLTLQASVNKKMGIAGGLLKGMSKIPIIGDLVDTDKALGAMESTLKEGGSSVKGLSAGFKNLRGQVIGGLTNPSNLALGAITQLVMSLKSVDAATGEMAKGLNLTYSEALATRTELTGIANASMDTAVNTKGLQDTHMAINSLLGARVSLDNESLVTMTKMREQAGFTNGELMGLLKLNTLNNQTQEETNIQIMGAAKAYAGKNKLAINEKEILKEISKSSASLTLSLGGGTEKLAESVVKAKQFGINLQQAEGIASSLLDFESSIENELSAELITGKSLNLEKARGLALSGDAVGAATEMLKQVGSAKKFGDMNVIAQESLAKAMGMTREEMSKSLIDKEQLTKLGVKDAKTAQEAYNTLRAQGMSESQIQQKLGKDANTQMFEQQSMQEKFNQTVVKLQEIFNTVATSLMPVFDIFGEIFSIVGPIVGLVGNLVSSISFLIKPLLVTVGLFKTLKFIGNSVYRNELLRNAASKAGLITDQQKLLNKGRETALSAEGVTVEKLSNFHKNQGLFTQMKTNIQKKFGNLLDKEGFIIKTRDLIMSKGKLALEFAMNAAKKVGLIIDKVGMAIGKSDFMITLANAAMAAFSSVAKIPFIGPILGIAAAASAVALGMSYMKDGVIGPGGETVVSGPKGSIQVDKDDSMIVGTDLGGKNKSKKSTGDSGGSTNVDMSQTNALLQQLISVIQSGGTVTLDGQAVGAALKLGSYEVQ